MNTITLNLLAEEQLAQQAQARDPVKVALAIGIGLCALCVLIGSLLAHSAESRKLEADALQTKWDALSASQSADPAGDTKSLKALADDILVLNHSRRLYAQQLALIKDLVPDTIQLDHVGFVISIDSSAPVTMEAGNSKDGDNAKTKRAARPSGAERLTLHLDGKAVNHRPEIEVDQFIQSLRANKAFNAQINDIKLRSIARVAPPSDPRAVGIPSASFVIECQYKDQK